MNQPLQLIIVDDEPLAGFNRRYVSDPFGNRIELLERLDGGTQGA